MDGIYEKLLAEHDNYTRLMTRVDVIVEMIRRDEFINTQKLLRVLGTEKAMQVEEELRKKDEERQSKEMEKYQGAVSGRNADGTESFE